LNKQQINFHTYATCYNIITIYFLFILIADQYKNAKCFFKTWHASRAAEGGFILLHNQLRTLSLPTGFVRCFKKPLGFLN
jgi:hypothetical protein